MSDVQVISLCLVAIVAIALGTIIRLKLPGAFVESGKTSSAPNSTIEASDPTDLQQH